MPALNSGHTIREVSHPQLVGAFCHELAVHPVTRSGFFPADCGADLFTPAHTGKPHHLNQPFFCAPGYGHPLTQQLASDLAHTVHAVVYIVHALYLRLQQVITLCPLTAFIRMPLMRTMPVIR